MLSGRFQEAIPGLFGALFGAGVLGWGAGWILTAYLSPPLTCTFVSYRAMLRLSVGNVQ